MRLEENQPNSLVNGIRPEAMVTVVSPDSDGMDALALECSDIFGALGRLTTKVDRDQFCRKKKV